MLLNARPAELRVVPSYGLLEEEHYVCIQLRYDVFHRVRLEQFGGDYGMTELVTYFGESLTIFRYKSTVVDDTLFL
jgi:hypothetical protein